MGPRNRGPRIVKGHNVTDVTVGGLANVQFGDVYMEQGTSDQLQREQSERERQGKSATKAIIITCINAQNSVQIR